MPWAVALEAVDLGLGAGGRVWVGLSAGGGIAGVCLAVVLLLESAIGAGVGLLKRVLGAGFVGLGGLRNLTCLVEALLPFGGLGMETRTFLQGFVDQVTFLVFYAEEKTFPVQLVYYVVVKGIFHLVDAVLECCVAFCVCRDGLQELWPVHKIQGLPGPVP